MSVHTAPDPDLDFFTRPVHSEWADDPRTSDAGLLLLRQFDHRVGLTRRFAAAVHDPRDPTRIDHSALDMTRMRVFGILAGYDDQNDHDTLRTDPVFKLLADRSPDGADLASQPTLSPVRTASTSRPCGDSGTSSSTRSWTRSPSRRSPSRSTSTPSTTRPTGTSNARSSTGTTSSTSTSRWSSPVPRPTTS